MISCDKCGRKNGPPDYVNNAIANVSRTGDDGKSSKTIQLFRGQLCGKCFETLAAVTKTFVDALFQDAKPNP